MGYDRTHDIRKWAKLSARAGTKELPLHERIICQLKANEIAQSLGPLRLGESDVLKKAFLDACRGIDEYVIPGKEPVDDYTAIADAPAHFC